MPNKDLSALIVNYNTANLLEAVLEHLQKAHGMLNLEYIVVDNASSDFSVQLMQTKFPLIKLLKNPQNVGFGRANNQALPYLQGRYVLLLNTDAFVSPDSLTKTVAYMDTHRECGILGVKLIGRDGTLQPSCRYFPTPWNLFLSRSGMSRFFSDVALVDDMAWDHASVRKCDWVPGCFYLIRREVIDQVGLFDPRFFLYYEEVDHCLAVKKAGWEVHYFPDTEVVHIGGESAKLECEITASGRQIEALQIESELLFFRKNYGVLAAFTDVLMTTLADFINATKRLLKWKRPFGLEAHARHIALMWQLYFRTRFGTMPTR